MRVWAASSAPHVDVNLSTEMFVNYWRAKAGRDATKVDWPATWRNWLLTDEQKAARAASAGRPMNRDEENLAVVARLAARESEQRGISA